MNKSTLASLLLPLAVASCATAATPSFQDFDGSQFNTNANKIRVKNGAPFTNTMIYGPTFSGEGTNGSGYAVSGTETRTNHTTGSSAVYSASGLLFYTNGVATIIINGPNASIVAGIITGTTINGTNITAATVNGTTVNASSTLYIPPILASVANNGYYQLLLNIPGQTNLLTTTAITINTTNGEVRIVGGLVATSLTTSNLVSGGLTTLSNLVLTGTLTVVSNATFGNVSASSFVGDTFSGTTFTPTTITAGTINLSTNLSITQFGSGALMTVGGVAVVSIQPGGFVVGTNLFASAVYPTVTNKFLITDTTGKIVGTLDGSALTNVVAYTYTTEGTPPNWAVPVVNSNDVFTSQIILANILGTANGAAQGLTLNGSGVTNLNADATKLWTSGNLTNLAVYQGAGFGFPLYGAGGTPTYFSGAGAFDGDFRGTFTGDGSGITNLAVNIFVNNVTNNTLNVTNLATFITMTINGKATFNSNVYVMQLNWTTNLMSSITINAQKAFEFMSTNNNISITGFSGVDGTNAHAFTRIFTNSAGSAAVKTIDLPAGTLVLSSPYSTTFYNTNQGILSGVIYPGAGTNVTWTGN